MNPINLAIGIASFISSFILVFVGRIYHTPIMAYEAAKFAFHLSHCENCRARLRRAREEQH